jgi:hypothetical protein
VSDYLQERSGSQFSAIYVDALLSGLDDILKLYEVEKKEGSSA